MSKALNNLYGLIPVVTIPYLLLAIGEGGWGDLLQLPFVGLKNLFTGSEKVNNPRVVVGIHLVITVLFFLALAFTVHNKDCEDNDEDCVERLEIFMNPFVVIGFLLHIVAIIYLFLVKLKKTSP